MLKSAANGCGYPRYLPNNFHCGYSRNTNYEEKVVRSDKKKSYLQACFRFHFPEIL